MSFGDCTSNFIYLTGSEDYALNLAKLCERFALKEKRVFLITSRQQEMAKRFSLNPLNCSKYLSILQPQDFESTPLRLLELQDSPAESSMRRPHLIVFDLQSLVLDALLRPVMQQCSRDKMVRHIAKCSASFVNYREILAPPIDTIVVMSQEPYPLSPAQFKLLIGLYFHGHECHTNFAKLSSRLLDAQVFK
ncbi:uncharacterized protein [Drosophila takahashii]|uniref:uncharacterized protein n=1 Tax=Drosophila takahashii TaxID=29030 RepID=UPI001CF8DAB6|nr:uncharacterized protein LOC108063020 [Drosophila takahashii]